MGQRTHIINQPGGIRESVATHRLLATRPLRERVFGTLGPFSWYLMETRLSTLGVTAAGEIDIIAGLLAPVEPNPYEELYQKAARQHAGQPPNFIDWIATKDLVDQGGIAWPPRTDVLVAIEVKCAYERDGKIRSSKNSPEKIRGLHKQLYRDLSFGFDFVGLLDIIANAPGTGDGSEAWWNA
ncbi:MAG TPA: hypothetical protein VJ728_18125, partial [Candidatus Binataceae bacterium]|nr:hypothetical protein [Candidatus Binataceae bacterium]